MNITNLSFKQFAKNILMTSPSLLLTIFVLTILSISASLTILPKLTSAAGTPAFLTGNIMTAGNRSEPTIDWGDPIDAKPGAVVEFRILAQNTVQDSTATNVKVTASLPSTPAKTLIATGTVSADNATSVS